VPELPEVETMVRALRPAVLGQTIVRTRLVHEDVLKNRTRSAFLRGLRQTTVVDVQRRAKNAVFDLGQLRLVVQPGMTGSFTTLPRGEAAPIGDYTVLSMALGNDKHLVYRDVRRLGRIYLMKPDEWATFSSRIGPEPLDPTLGAEEFGASLRRSRQAVKKVIMDQRRLAGVGNIYANEALFVAGIDPSKPANALTRDDHERLLGAIRRILGAAIRAEGTTIRDYRTTSGQPGNFQMQLFVYGREGEPCLDCEAPLVATHTIDARSTVFCFRCQT